MPVKQILPECKVAPAVYHPPKPKSFLVQQLEYFCRTTANHGFAHLVDENEPCCLRITWVLAIIGLGGFLTQVIYLSAVSFLSGALTTEFLEQIPHGGQYQSLPDIHICDSSIFNRSRLKVLGFNATMATYLTLATYENLANPTFLQNITYRAALKEELDRILDNQSLTLKYITENVALKCEDLVHDCSKAGYYYSKHNCCETFFHPQPSVSIFGSCISTRGKSIYQQAESRYSGLVVYIIPNDVDIINYDTKLIQSDYVLPRGLYFAVSSPTEHPLTALQRNGRFAAFDSWVLVPITKTVDDNSELRNNPLAPHTCIHTNDSLNKKILTPEHPYYSQTNCFMSRSQKLYRTMYGCSAIFYEYGNATKLCSPEEIIKSNVSVLLKGQNDCPIPCVADVYQTAPSYAKFNHLVLAQDHEYKDLKEKLVALHFFYPTFKYQLRVSHTATYMNYLSRVGGNLGLFLGASLISLLELAVFFIRCLIKYFC